MTLVDTNVLLDILVDSREHGEASARRLAVALASGSVAVNHIIAAELAPAFDREDDLWASLEDGQIELTPFPREAIYLAGQSFLAYRKRGGRRTRILSDFLIGAHAQATGAGLLTRDRGFYRAYFPKLRLARA